MGFESQNMTVAIGDPNNIAGTQIDLISVTSK